MKKRGKYGSKNGHLMIDLAVILVSRHTPFLVLSCATGNNPMIYLHEALTLTGEPAIATSQARRVSLIHFCSTVVRACMRQFKHQTSRLCPLTRRVSLVRFCSTVVRGLYVTA